MQHRESLINYPGLPPEIPLGTGLKISTDLLTRLTPEFLKVDDRNQFSGKRLKRFLACCTVAPPLGGALALGAAAFFKSPELALFGGPLLIGGGPAGALALYFQDLKETEKLKGEIDDSILNHFLNQVAEEEINFSPSELDKLLDVWNPIRRASDKALAKRLMAYKELSGTKQGLTALLISPFILFERSGMVGEEKIISIGVEKLISLSATEKREDKGFFLFTTAALNLLYQKGASRRTVQKASIGNPYLRTDRREMIMADPKTFNKQLKAFASYGEMGELREWYGGVLSFLEKTSSLSPQGKLE